MYEWQLALLVLSIATIYMEKNFKWLANQRKRLQIDRLHRIGGGIVTDSSENAFISDGGYNKEHGSDNGARRAPRLTSSVQQLVRAIICDDPVYVAGGKPTANELKFRPLTEKNSEIEKEANFRKIRALQSNVRRISSKATNATTRRRNTLLHQNAGGSARFSHKQVTYEFDLGHFHQDSTDLIRSPYI